MRYLVAVLVLFVVAVGCGHAASPPAPVVAGGEVHERIVPHICAARSKVASLLGRGEAPRPPELPQQEALHSVPPEASGSDPYRVGAPATVMIISEHAMGTGVVVDPRGYVLTNWHVVHDGRKTDLLETVSVAFGDLSPTGRMSKQEKHYDASVVKWDATRDLALLRIKDPPPRLASVRLASGAPRVGEKVTAIGNAGIGFLWAAKSCSVASIGERQHDFASYAALDCSIVDPGLAAAAASKTKADCESLKKKVDDVLLADVQGLAIETDCALTHGDSGGPLLNAGGEVVGLNQGLRADVATVSFHVHVDEIRDFTSSFPVDPVPVLPDPYCDGGDVPSLEDLDADGTPETLVAVTRNAKGRVERMSLLIDLDEDDAQRARTGPDPFDAEVALVADKDGTYVWYDADNDGTFEILLVDRDGDGLPEKAYHLGSGPPKEDAAILPKHDLTDKFVKPAAQLVRLGRIASAIGGKRLGSAIVLGVASRAPAVPSAVTGTGTQARAYDSDADGRLDCASTRTSFAYGLLMDADPGALAPFKNGTMGADLGKAKLDPKVAVIFGLTSTWVTYDLDRDGKADLALEDASALGTDSLYATSAYHAADMSPAPEQLGRRIFRASLVPSMPRVASGFRLFKLDHARDEGLESFPTLIPSKAVVVMRPTKDVVDGTVVTASAGGWTTTFIDVDHNTKLKKPIRDEDVEHALADNRLDAEVAVVRRGNSEGGTSWTFFDTDNDGKFDLVIYSATERDVTQAYRVKGSAVTVEPAFATGRPLRTKGVFKNKALGAKWKTIAKAVFKASSVEE